MNGLIHRVKTLFCIIVCGTCFVAHAAPVPLGTAFDYRGRLDDGGPPANGTYDFIFTLYDAETGGSAVGTVNARPAVPVSDGVFVVRLNFGDQELTFNGQACWLGIQVRSTAAGGVYTLLTPRQPVPLAPYSFYALYAGGLIDADEVEVNQHLQVGKDTDPDGFLAVYGQSRMTGSVQMQSGLSVAGAIQGDMLSVGNGMNINGPATFSGAISALGNLNANGTVSSGAINTGTINADTVRAGNTELSGGLTVSGGGNLLNGLNVNGTVNANGDLSVAGVLGVQTSIQGIEGPIVLAGMVTGDGGVIQARDDLAVGRDLGVNGNVQIQGTLGANNNVTLGGDLIVAGSATIHRIDCNLDISGDVGSVRNLNMTGHANVGGGLTCTGNLHVNGPLYVTGTKSFIQPHPTDPTKEIVFTCLEGPEAGTYTRGTAELVNGEATVTLPEAFLLITGDEDVTAQMTPRGTWLQLYVVSADARTLVVREAGGRSGRFDFLVQGVRKGYEQQPVIRDRVPPGGTP